ncbi:MAG: DNA internalization-related competence protein ComEC/Rec2 [Desulfobacteraceae bacterium]|nr:DNA internalization-related competence protein ComEC/Rec2 [Desulfobacteraceae bacterium]
MKKILNFGFPPLIPVVLSLITGILVGNRFPGLPLGAFAAVALVFLVAVSRFFLKLKPLVMGISFISMVWGFFSLARILNPDVSLDLVSQLSNSSKYTITGEIVSFSKDYSRKKRVVIFCNRVEKKGMPPVNVHGRIILNIYDKNKELFQYGDLIQFTSYLKPIRNFSNPNGFDYEKLMKFSGVFGSAYVGADKIRVIPRPIDFHIKIMRNLEQVRNRFFYFVMDGMENRNAAAILVALVTGKKEAIPLKLKDLFSRAGTSHLLAISGLHLSIVALGFFGLFYFLLARVPMFLMKGIAKKTAGILTLIPLCFYGVFSGFSPSTQRAFIMISIFMISFLSEKENNPLNTLALAAIVILIYDSAALFSISFQLSFGALLFILIGFSLIKIRGWIPKKKLITIVTSAALVTFFAGLGTFPLIAHYFNLISYVQILSNLVLVPLMGFICLPLGFMVFLIFPICPVPAELLVNLCQGILSFCIAYIQFLTSFKLSWSRIVAFDVPEMILVYLFFAGVALYIVHQKKTGLVLVILAVLAGSFSFTTGLKTKLFQKKMIITILDVGQGNSALIQTIEGKNILVDGGGFSDRSSFDIGRYVVGPFLWSQKIFCLDAVILTHPESDHMNGLLYILENFKVNLVVKNRDTASSRAYKGLMALCRENTIRVWHPSTGDTTLGFDRTRLIFFRDIPGSGQNLNNNSLVFQVRFNKFSLLFTGDILNEREMVLARQNMYVHGLKSSLLISPHHGSLTSSSKIFLDKVNPESVIISCGFGNQYGFPHPDVLKRYNNMGYGIFRTDIDGAVTISSDGIVYNILTHKGG